MELKDIIMIGSFLIAAGGLIVAILAYRSKKKLQQEHLKLQHEMHEFQKEKEDKGELKEKIEEFKGKLEKGSNRDIYCRHIMQKFQYLDFTGLNAILQKPLLLESIYVKLKAKPSYRLATYHSIADFNQLKEEAEDTEERDKKAGEDFVAVFARLVKEYERKQEPMKLVILGQPGSGKTTLMKWIALQCACRKEDAFADFIPVFIPLKDLGRDPEKTYRAKNIRDLTMDMLDRETISPSFIKDSFESNQLLFLLDGLDEVAEEDRRREVIDWIQRQNIRKNALLVTSRFSGLQEAKGLKFHDAFPVFAVQDFDIADIERFLENWYQNIEVAVAGADNKNGAVQKGEKEYEHLMEIIKSGSHENLRKLAVNPLLLTIIAIVHRTRAVLPKERHKLYEECLKVMIELWNVANRKLDVSFTVENSLDNLSNLAVFLMTENRREMELREIEDQLPGEIEGKSLDFFLKEMVLKAGLLYESEGKYGFLHLTFQEYLAAWHFARGKDQNAILAFRDKDYWTETFKLFVNIANAHTFFAEIIANLLEKGYWWQMQLWEDCLADIVVEKSRGDIEIEFAQRILNILPDIEYKEENEPLISQLYAHYPLYQYADRFVKEGWHLFDHARHPFVRTVGSSMLNQAGVEAQAQLIGALKVRINDFEKQEAKVPGALMKFLYWYNNSLVILLSGRRNVRDFCFALAKLKSSTFFIAYLILQDLLNPQELLDIRRFRGLGDLLDLPYLLDLQFLRYLGYYRYTIYFPGIRNIRNSRGFKDFRNLQSFLYLRDEYLENQTFIENHKPEISAWASKAMAKLHALPDEELLKYFPGTSREDLKIFRTHYPPFIAKELKKGDYTILKELHLDHELLEDTEKLVDDRQGQGAFYQVLIDACADNSPEMKAQRKPIIQYLLDKEKLTIDRPTILGLLNFDIDLDNEENQALELNAFYYLSDKDWAKLRELVVGVVEIPPNQTIGLNAVYIFKYIN